MDLSKNSCSNTNYKQRKQFPMERRPRMLKDYLIDEPNSCSSGGFRSFPRKPSNSSVRTLMSIDLNDACNKNSSISSKLLRSRSKAAASTAISALQIFITAVKNIQFKPIKPASILPRSLSRRLSKRNASNKSKNKENEIEKTTITVKDIMRWRSFRDLVEEEKSAPEDLAPLPPHCTTTATTTTWSNTTTPRSSNGSSWCDSDFTSEYLTFWNGNSVEFSEKESAAGKKSLPCVGEDSADGTKATRTYVEKGQQEEEKDQHSPVSVIDFGYEEYEESSSSFDESLAAMERAKQNLMQKIRRFESLAKLDSVNLEDWMDERSISDDEEEGGEGMELNTTHERGEEEADEIEEKAWQLLNHVKATGAGAKESCRDSSVDHLLVDFFSDELAAQKREDNAVNGFDYEVVNRAKSWINGEDRLLIRWEEQCKREAYVRDMDRLGKWTMFEEEREELGLEFDSGLLGLLLDELLLELVLG